VVLPDKINSAYVETAKKLRDPDATPLKRGVNEIKPLSRVRHPNAGLITGKELNSALAAAISADAEAFSSEAFGKQNMNRAIAFRPKRVEALKGCGPTAP